MVTVVYHVTQLCLLGYRRARCPLEIKASAQTSFPAGFATGLSLVHLNAPEKRTQEDVAGRTVSPPMCQPFSGSRKEQGRQPSAGPRVTSQQMLPCIATREQRRSHVRGQRSPCQEEEAMGGSGQAPLGNVKMAQSGDPAGDPHGWRSHPTQEACFCFPSTTPEWIQGFHSSPTCQEGKGHLAQLRNLQVGRQAWKGQGCKERGCRAGTAASCPGPEPALCPLRSQNSIFHLFSCNGDVFLHFCFWGRRERKGQPRVITCFRETLDQLGKVRKGFLYKEGRADHCFLAGVESSSQDPGRPSQLLMASGSFHCWSPNLEYSHPSASRGIFHIKHQSHLSQTSLSEDSMGNNLLSFPILYHTVLLLFDSVVMHSLWRTL